MRMCVLGSGSSGNSSLLDVGGGALLIDMGFGPRATGKRLAGTGIGIGDISAALLTHLDRDHFNPNWFATLHRHGIVVYCHRRHLHALYRHSAGAGGIDARRLHRRGLIRPFDDQPFEMVVNDRTVAHVRPQPLLHDRNGTIGFRIDAAGGRLGYATDLGRVPDHLIEAFANVDVLALESNYDPPMQINSARPAMLKRRIMGGYGHLSNEQALEAIGRIVDRSTRPPQHIVLLHLSRQCNDPQIVWRLHAANRIIAQRLCITCQSQPTGWLSNGAAPQPLAGQQMTLNWQCA